MEKGRFAERSGTRSSFWVIEGVVPHAEALKRAQLIGRRDKRLSKMPEAISSGTDKIVNLIMFGGFIASSGRILAKPNSPRYEAEKLVEIKPRTALSLGYRINPKNNTAEFFYREGDKEVNFKDQANALAKLMEREYDSQLVHSDGRLSAASVARNLLVNIANVKGVGQVEHKNPSV